MTNNNGGLRGLFPVFVALLACLYVGIGASAQYNTPPESGAGNGIYKPAVFVDGILYEDIGRTVLALPEGAALLGQVEKLVSRDEPMEKENFCSNSVPAGSRLYRDEAEPEAIYVEPASGGEGYSVFEALKG